MVDILDLEQRIKGGYMVSYAEAVEFERSSSTQELCALAEALREFFCGKSMDTCSIMNARSGRCSENCKWCSQSKFHATDVDIYPLVEAGEAVKQAQYNANKGVRRFSLVTSGRTMSDLEIEKCCDIYNKIQEVTDIYLCASMGLLTKAQLKKLYDFGVKRYHCNLESAPSYFPELCTTHTTAEKLQTIRWAREVGMEICSGGIIGMGESAQQRLELAATLQKEGVMSIPVNILNPIKGTALADMPPLSDDEIIRTVAMFRIINPGARIRLAGGRTIVQHLMERLLHSGVNAAIVGDMLTTIGSQIDADKELFTKEGFEL